VQYFFRRPKGRYHLGDLRIDGRILLKLIFKKRDVRVWTGFVWLRTGTSGRLFRTWH
jgi:hypothetical protein